jgi:hypothetical protein
MGVQGRHPPPVHTSKLKSGETPMPSPIESRMPVVLIVCLGLSMKAHRRDTKPNRGNFRVGQLCFDIGNDTKKSTRFIFS